MKLAEALKITTTSRPDGAEEFKVYLACGFEPLHIRSFLCAHLLQALPNRRVEVQVGNYGDLAGNLDRLGRSDAHAGAVVIEWSDIDARLGLRALGGWQPDVLSAIQLNAQKQTHRLLDFIERAAATKPLAICLPTLPLPPIFQQPGEQASGAQMLLDKTLAEFAFAAAETPRVKIVSGQRMNLISPTAERLDVKSELTAGFPYRTSHASNVAELLVSLLQPRAPKKGLITDLDDTMWRGLLGEDGLDAVSWDLDHKSHIHALYQQLLDSLAGSGVLVAIASKNDRAYALEALNRADIIVAKDRLFPIEISWQSKSDSVGRILQAWNIGADSVVFIDDSPIELAEVKSVYPEIDCLQFPTRDDQAAYSLFERLRDLFGKGSVSEDDAIRLESVRQNTEFQNQRTPGSADEFLAQLEAEITFSAVEGGDQRAFELINKTNQFNLNGRRLTEHEFESALERRYAVSLVVSYKDKFGPLGKIGALLGYVESSILFVDTWVMSCRAFSRRIEHRCIEHLFDRVGISEIEFDFQLTPRNEPLREFLAEMTGSSVESKCTLSRDTFERAKPTLYHSIKEVIHA